MLSTDDILRRLGADDPELDEALFAAAAASPEVIAKLSALCERAASRPRSLTSHDGNLVAWAPYVFAEAGDPDTLRPLLGVCRLRERHARHVLGGYAAYDLPSIFLRLAGDGVTTRLASLLRTRDAAPELRIAPAMACVAAWAHGLISREEALKPLREELARLADPEIAEAESDVWVDTVLDAALTAHPADLKDALDAAAETLGLDESWDDEYAGAAKETLEETRLALRSEYPRLGKAVGFIAGWDAIDAEADEAAE